MGWDFRLLPHLGVLSVKTAGDLDYDRMLEFIEAAAAEMQKHGVDRILVDHRDADAALEWLLDRGPGA